MASETWCHPGHKGGRSMDSSVLVNDNLSVKVGERSYQVGKLSLGQGLRLSKFFAETVLVSQDKLKKLQEETSDSDSNTNDLMAIINLLEENDLYRFIGIVLNEDDIEYLSVHLDFENTSAIAVNLVENNSFDIVKKNISRIQTALEKKKEIK